MYRVCYRFICMWTRGWRRGATNTPLNHRDTDMSSLHRPSKSLSRSSAGRFACATASQPPKHQPFIPQDYIYPRDEQLILKRGPPPRFVPRGFLSRGTLLSSTGQDSTVYIRWGYLVETRMRAAPAASHFPSIDSDRQLPVVYIPWNGGRDSNAGRDVLASAWLARLGGPLTRSQLQWCSVYKATRSPRLAIGSDTTLCQAP